MNANQAIIRYGGIEVRDKNQHLRPLDLIMILIDGILVMIFSSITS